MTRALHWRSCHRLHSHAFIFRRKSDIENERLPPELVDPESAEAQPFLSHSNTPSSHADSPPVSGIEDAIASGSLPATPGSAPGSFSTPVSPISPTSGVFRRGHARQQSLGTTKTSPSTRRRSIENTISLIKEAVDGTPGMQENELEDLADHLSSPSKSGNVSPLHGIREGGPNGLG